MHPAPPSSDQRDPAGVRPGDRGLLGFRTLTRILALTLALALEPTARTAAGESVAPATSIVSLTLFSPELRRGLEASAAIYNLFHPDYGEAVSDPYQPEFIAQDGRTFRMKLGYHL